MTQEEIDAILADLADFFGELDDGEARPFGEFARVDVVDGDLIVKHQEAERGVRIIVQEL